MSVPVDWRLQHTLIHLITELSKQPAHGHVLRHVYGHAHGHVARIPCVCVYTHAHARVCTHARTHMSARAHTT